MCTWSLRTRYPKKQMPGLIFSIISQIGPFQNTEELEAKLCGTQTGKEVSQKHGSASRDHVVLLSHCPGAWGTSWLVSTLTFCSRLRPLYFICPSWSLGKQFSIRPVGLSSLLCWNFWGSTIHWATYLSLTLKQKCLWKSVPSLTHTSPWASLKSFLFFIFLLKFSTSTLLR